LNQVGVIRQCPNLSEYVVIENNYKLEQEESTEGININTWIIPQEEMAKINPKVQRDFQINIWDFGGQEIYHSTHQFFLTKRSIYMLVTESRKEDSHDDFFYWLNIIKLLGDKSPVMMVLNKSDQPTKDLPIKEYKETFSNIQGFEKISLTDGYEETVIHFKRKLKELASNLPHIGSPLPKRWVEIRREIEILKKSGLNYITESAYFEICKKHYRKEESALFLSDFFHDLGVLLHFRDDIELKDTVILNHEWITSGVYKILDDRQVINQRGHFSYDDIKRIWSNVEHKDKQRELISLMKNKKFDLCFELASGEYLVPRLLPVDEIEHNWISSLENSKFEFRYNFMPKGILARLIVKLNNDIFENKYWRYGVVLHYENTKAIIKEKYFENKITIELVGENKREYLFTIRKAINEIHNDFNKLKVSEWIPCICSHCKTVEQPFFYEFELLKRYELKEIANIRCDFSLEKVNVFELTSDVIKSRLSPDRLVFCENKNADVLKGIKYNNIIFFPEKDSSSVFIKVKTKPDAFGLRDRDFLLDTEIERIKKKYPNYFILEYYCFENYLLHPNNIAELNLNGLSIEDYKNAIIKQKNLKKNHIISIYRNSRNTYQEFKIEHENLRDKINESDIMDYLESDNFEIFLKAFSMKDHFDKVIISKYNLKQSELANTKWFKERLNEILGLSKVN
jgi:internalin A